MYLFAVLQLQKTSLGYLCTHRFAVSGGHDLLGSTRSHWCHIQQHHGILNYKNENPPLNRKIIYSLLKKLL
jgi:hypothetical protein